MEISRRRRLGTIVVLLTLLLLVGLATPALAQFAPGDLAGTWHLRAFSTDNGDSGEPGQRVSGTVALSASGTVVSGSVTMSDGTMHPLTPGTKLTLAANGLVSGPLTWAGVPRTVRATMTFDQNAVIGVADDATHTINTSLALVRHPSTAVGQADSRRGMGGLRRQHAREPGLAKIAVSRVGVNLAGGIEITYAVTGAAPPAAAWTTVCWGPGR